MTMTEQQINLTVSHIAAKYAADFYKCLDLQCEIVSLLAAVRKSDKEAALAVMDRSFAEPLTAE